MLQVSHGAHGMPTVHSVQYRCGAVSAIQWYGRRRQHLTASDTCRVCPGGLLSQQRMACTCASERDAPR